MICLILPNYTQSSSIFALVFNNATRNWEQATYSQAVSSLGLPISWARGIPGPVQQRHPENDFVLGQLATSSSGITYQSWACRAGIDTTGRDVFLTLIAQNEAEVKQAFPSANPTGLDNVITAAEDKEPKRTEETDYYQITETQKKYFIDALDKIIHVQGFSANSIQKMLDKARKTYFGHYVSVSFNGMSYLPDSEQGDDVGRLPFRKGQAIGLMALVVLSAAVLVSYTMSSKKAENMNNDGCDSPSTSHNDNSQKNETCKNLSIQK